jgi:hypothetical protein
MFKLNVNPRNQRGDDCALIRAASAGVKYGALMYSSSVMQGVKVSQDGRNGGENQRVTAMTEVSQLAESWEREQVSVPPALGRATSIHRLRKMVSLKWPKKENFRVPPGIFLVRFFVVTLRWPSGGHGRGGRQAGGADVCCISFLRRQSTATCNNASNPLSEKIKSWHLTAPFLGR